MAKSSGIQCAACGCFTYSYVFENGERVPSNISLFCFPDDAEERKVWCYLIKRQENKDGFKIGKSTRICEKHFPVYKSYKPPGGTRKKFMKGARPMLHPWNSFKEEQKLRKPPLIRYSPRKKKKSEQQEETNTEKHVGDNLNDFSNEQCVENFDETEKEHLRKRIEELEKDNNVLSNSCLKLQYENETLKKQLLNFDFQKHVISDDQNCNH